MIYWCVLFFQAEDGIRDIGVTGVQTCALPIWGPSGRGLRLPEDPVDLGDVVQQLLGLGRVHAALAAGGAGLLGRLVEQLVQLRVLLEGRGLEVVEIGRASCRARV